MNIFDIIYNKFDYFNTHCTNISICFKINFNLKSGICVAFKKSGSFTVTKTKYYFFKSLLDRL